MMRGRWRKCGWRMLRSVILSLFQGRPLIVVMVVAGMVGSAGAEQWVPVYPGIPAEHLAYDRGSIEREPAGTLVKVWIRAALPKEKIDEIIADVRKANPTAPIENLAILKSRWQMDCKNRKYREIYVFCLDRDMNILYSSGMKDPWGAIQPDTMAGLLEKTLCQKEENRPKVPTSQSTKPKKPRKPQRSG